MKRFKNILISVHPDISNMEIVERVAKMAKANDAKIKVLHVIGDYPENMKEWWNVRNPEKLHAQIVRERQDFLDAVVERVKEVGVQTVESALRWSKEGRVFLQIISEVDQDQHDLVIVTSQRKNEANVFAKMMLESPTIQLFRYCPVPLWVSRGILTKRFKRIAVALKSTDGEIKCEGFNAKLVEIAAAIAYAEDSELHIVHALPIYGGHGLEKNTLHADLVKYLEDKRHEIAEDVKHFLSNTNVTLKMNEETVHLFAGSPVDVIPDFLHEMGMGLLVMGTVARTGIRGLVVGNTSEKILNRIDCGILAVKPDDFVSLALQEEKMSE